MNGKSKNDGVRIVGDFRERAITFSPKVPCPDPAAKPSRTFNEGVVPLADFTDSAQAVAQTPERESDTGDEDVSDTVSHPPKSPGGKRQSRSPLDGWDLEHYRAILLTRAKLLRMNPRMRVRYEESDLVQDTFQKAAHPSTPPCKGQSDHERMFWLEEIQNHVYLDRYRNMHAQTRDIDREQRLSEILDYETVDCWEIATDPAPIDEIARKESAQLLMNALEQLPFEQRYAVMARDMLHLSLKEAAIALNKTEGQVAGLYHRAVARLKELLRSNSSEI